MKRIRSKLVHSKIFIQRSMSWISIVNAGMLLFLVLSQLEKYGVNVEMKKWLIPIFLASIILMVIFGYLEDRLGFHEQEAEVSSQRNPYLMEIHEKVNKIEKKLEKMDKK